MSIKPQITEAITFYPEADSFNIKSSLESIKASIVSHLLLISFICLLTVSLVVTYIVVWPPVFEASVVISADSEADLQRNAFYQQWNIFRREAVGDEAILMTSDPVLRRVITELDLTYEEVYHPFSSYFIHLWGESWIGRNYRKVKYMIFPKEPLPKEITEEMLEKFKVLKDFRKSVSLVPIGEANIALLIVKGATHRVAETANKVIDTYLDERRNRYIKEARLARNSLQIETDSAYEKLLTVEAELLEFYSKNSLLLTFEKDRVQMTQWLNLQAEINDLESHKAQLSETLAILEQQLKTESQEVKGVKFFQDNIVNLNDKLTQLKITLKLQEQEFLAISPEIIKLKRQVSAMENIIEQKSTILAGQKTKARNELYETLRSKIGQIKSELAGIQAALQTKKAIVDEFRPLMQELPLKMHKTYQLKRQQLLLEGQYKALNEKLVQATVSMATAKSAPAALRVIDYASSPDKASWPNKKLMVLVAILFGLLTGITYALIIDMIFVKVNRHKLATRTNAKPAYAILTKDDNFLDNIYLPDKNIQGK